MQAVRDEPMAPKKSHAVPPLVRDGDAVAEQKATRAGITVRLLEARFGRDQDIVCDRCAHWFASQVYVLYEMQV
jgi:hypothetical protein